MNSLFSIPPKYEILVSNRLDYDQPGRLSKKINEYGSIIVSTIFLGGSEFGSETFSC